MKQLLIAYVEASVVLPVVQVNTVCFYLCKDCCRCNFIFLFCGFLWGHSLAIFIATSVTRSMVQ